MKELIVLLLLLASNTHAESPNLCRAPYALTHDKFNYSEYKKSLVGVNSYTVSFLWNTFGNNLDNIKRELNDPRVNGLQLILVNENCAKYPRCGNYELLAGMNTDKFRQLLRQRDPAFKSKVEQYAANAANFFYANVKPTHKKYLNPLLESKCSREEWQIFAEWVRPYFPDWIFVWNPLGAKPGLPQPPAMISEGHGDNPKFDNSACIANPDGTSIDGADWESYFRKYTKCTFVCGWTGNDNCINSGSQGFIDPRKRDCKDTSKFAAVGAGMRAAQVQIEPVPEWSEADNKSFAGCTEVKSPSDGKGGFLWKQSHVPGYGVAIMFPARYPKFDKVEVLKEGMPVGSVKWAPGKGFPDQAASNKFRPIYRTSRKQNTYPYNVVVAGKVNNKKYCWMLRNSKVRND